MIPPNADPRKRGVAREVFVLWGLAFGSIALAKALGVFLPWIGRNVKAVAAAAFLFLPSVGLRRRGGTWDDLGVPDLPWRGREAARRFFVDLGWGLGVFLLLVPPVVVDEEVFFRGYVQTRLKEAWGEGKLRILGVRTGAYFWVTQLLFATAHLGDLDASRLSVFFPSILFGWLRERTGSIGASVWVHAGSNLLLKVLEASSF